MDLTLFFYIIGVKNMRDLSIVIDNMIKEIPGELRVVSRLKAIRQTFLYAAPELHGDIWNQCAWILNSELSNVPACDWTEKVGKIFNGEIQC